MNRHGASAGGLVDGDRPAVRNQVMLVSSTGSGRPRPSGSWVRLLRAFGCLWHVHVEDGFRIRRAAPLSPDQHGFVPRRSRC